ncbi:elongation factor P [Candidatus Berkelbacteria bacterium]|nr:elongation factor P [Candidatus Berkelbacteria bacterium]
MALSIAQIKAGMVIVYRGKPYQVLQSAHLKMGRGRGIQQVRMQSLVDASMIDNKFRGNEEVEEADLKTVKGQFLYADADTLYFMDSGFEQFGVAKNFVGGKSKFLVEGNTYDIVYFDDKPIDLRLPIKMIFTVIATDPGLRGDRISAGTKPATLENGAVVQVPLFIKNGEKIVIETRDSSYVERAK